MVNMSSKQISEWQDANKKNRNSVVQLRSTAVIVTRWLAPDRRWLKLKVDVALQEGEGSFAIGMVLKNENGEFVMVKNLRMAGQVTVMEAEAYGVCEALRW